MKSFKSIREGNSVEPGVSEINDVSEDPLSFVEIKPKKTKIIKEAMSKDDKSSVALQAMVAKKNLQQTAGKNKSQAFVDKMVSKVNAGDRLPKKPADEYDRKVTSYLKKKYNEETEQIDELKKSTLGSYIKKASDSATMSAYDAGGESQRHGGEPVSKRPDTYGADRKAAIKRLKGIDKATDRLTKEEAVVETKGAPKGFHFTKDGKLKRGDANQDGDGGTMLRADPLDKQRNKVPAVSEKVEPITSKDIKMAVGVAKDKRYTGGNMSGAVKAMEKMKPGLSNHPRVQQVLKSTNEGIDFLKIWNGIKPVHEEIKTTHEDPLVVTKDEDGNIHTHANLSVANAIHGTNVKHQAIHTGKPVQGGKFTFELSKHHEGALKEDAPFDPVAHKKELDQLMGKHMAAHTETTKLINAKAPQEAINKAQERNNAVKQEIRNHKDKVPKGPTPKKDGGPGDYYASKKPGEYTGD